MPTLVNTVEMVCNDVFAAFGVEMLRVCFSSFFCSWQYITGLSNIVRAKERAPNAPNFLVTDMAK